MGEPNAKAGLPATDPHGDGGEKMGRPKQGEIYLNLSQVRDDEWVDDECVGSVVSEICEMAIVKEGVLEREQEV